MRIKKVVIMFSKLRLPRKASVTPPEESAAPIRRTATTAKAVASATKRKRELPRDCRTQLFNEGEHGLISKIQVSRERIYQQRGILFDIDPGILQSNSFFKVDRDLRNFYAQTIRPMLDRDPVLTRAKVIASGSGLHVVLAFAAPEPCDTDAARERVEAIIEAVLPILPVDPDQPGITATRRTVGSINSKNSKKVSLLAKGEPIPFAEIEGLAARISSSPFATVVGVLAAEAEMSPCPICAADGSSLAVFPYFGSCYGSSHGNCGRVSLEQVWEKLYQPRTAGKGVRRGEA